MNGVRYLPYRVARTILSLETLLVLFLFAGRFKTHPALAWVPVDLTALLFGASVVVALGALYRGGMALPRRGLATVLSMLPLLVWMTLSRLWSPSTVYASSKILYSWTLLFLPLSVTALVVAADRERVERFLTMLVTVALLLSVDVLSVARTSGLRNLMFMMGAAYLGMGRAFGLAVIVLWMRSAARTGMARFVLAGLALLLMFVILVMGGRGPFLATIAGLAVPLFLAALRPDVRRAMGSGFRWSVTAGAIAVVIVAVVMAAGFTPRTLERTGELVGEEQHDESSVQRAIYYDKAVHYWRESPLLGNGVGSFPILISRGDQVFYPHNLLLEMLVELGVLGLAFLLLPLIGGLRNLRLLHGGADLQRLMILALFINALVNAQVTEDLTGNRILFVMLGLMAVTDRSKEGP